MVKKALLAFFTWKIFIFINTFYLAHLFPDVPLYIAKNLFADKYPELIWRFANMDGIHYLRIAKHGYNSTIIPFFPFYPLAIRFFADLFFHHKYFTPISQIISNGSFLLSLFVIYKLLQADNKVKLYLPMLFILFTFPTSFFYGATYNDALFFLLSTLSIYAMRKNNILASSVWAALATLTRLNGLALFAMLWADYFSRINYLTNMAQISANIYKLPQMIGKSFSYKLIFKNRLYFTLLIPSAFISFLLFIQFKFGDWHMIFSSMKAWSQDRIIFPPQVFYRYFRILILYPTFKLNYWIAGIELLFVLFYIFILIYAFDKIRISYWIFMFISFLMPVLTGTFSGMPRYGLHLYPFFLSICLFIIRTNRLIRILYLTSILFLFFLLLTLYINGYFVA